MPKPWRIPAIYAFAIPLALILGCLVSSPEPITFTLLGVILLFLAIPLILKWHHTLLIIFWNACFFVFFLPGQPNAWLVIAAVSFGISSLNFIMVQKQFLRVPEMTRPLLFLALVVVGTACCRGGIGLRALGSSNYGGRYYVYVLGAIIGYFALAADAIPISKSGKMIGVFFLSGTTFVLSNLAYTFGPAFYFLYYIVPSGAVAGQVASDFGLTNIDRIAGLSETCIALFCFLLVRFGVRGVFEFTKPWRFALLLVTVMGGFFAGYRSITLLLFLIFGFQFYFEGVWRTHLLPVAVGLALFGVVPILFFSDKMPPVMQRAISFLPVKVDADVRADAKGSSEWRFQMWATVWKDVPKYLILGKGYDIDPTDLFLTTEAVESGILNGNEIAILAGDYHSGPLSVLIPFGLFGMAAFVWVLGAGYWVLHSNYHYGDVRLRRMNSVLLSLYLAYCISFFLIFGAFNSQLFVFLGICGLSVSLNAGAAKRGSTNGRPFVRLERFEGNGVGHENVLRIRGTTVNT